MSTETAVPNTSSAETIASKAIEQAAASSTAAAPGEAGAGGAAPAAPVETYNPFQAEDAEAEARVAQLAEEAKKAEQAKAAPAAAGQPAATGTTDPAAAADPAKTSQNTVQSALIAMRRRLAEEARARAVAEGRAQALEAVIRGGNQPAGATPEGGAQPGGDPGAGEPPTIEAQLDSIDQGHMAIAEKVDRGDISEADAERERAVLRKKERELLAQQAEEIAAARATPAPTNDLGLEEHLKTLVADYTVLQKLEADDLAPIQALVIKQSRMPGGNPIAAGPIGTKDLRERMAVLAEQMYDPAAWAARQAKGAATAGAQPGATGQPATTTTGSQPTAAEREAKLRMAATMAPDIGRIGAAAPAGDLSLEAGEAQYNAITDSDQRARWLDAHPSFKAKVMGTSWR